MIIALKKYAYLSLISSCLLFVYLLHSYKMMLLHFIVFSVSNYFHVFQGVTIVFIVFVWPLSTARHREVKHLACGHTAN